MDYRLYRSRRDRMLAGVAGGLAEMWDADPSLVRIIWALLVIFTGGIALLVYIVMAIVVPGGGRGVPGPQRRPCRGPPDHGPRLAGEPRARRRCRACRRPATPRKPATAARAEARSRHVAQRAPNVVAGCPPGLLFGGFLVLLGLFFLVREYLPEIDFDWFWPLILVRDRDPAGHVRDGPRAAVGRIGHEPSARRGPLIAGDVADRPRRRVPRPPGDGPVVGRGVAAVRHPGRVSPRSSRRSSTGGRACPVSGRSPGRSSGSCVGVLLLLSTTGQPRDRTRSSSSSRAGRGCSSRSASGSSSARCSRAGRSRQERAGRSRSAARQRVGQGQVRRRHAHDHVPPRPATLVDGEFRGGVVHREHGPGHVELEQDTTCGMPGLHQRVGVDARADRRDPARPEDSRPAPAGPQLDLRDLTLRRLELKTGASETTGDPAPGCRCHRGPRRGRRGEPHVHRPDRGRGPDQVQDGAGQQPDR